MEINVLLKRTTHILGQKISASISKTSAELTFKICKNEKSAKKKDGYKMIRKLAILSLGIVGLLAASVVISTTFFSTPQKATQKPKSIIPLEKIVSGGPPKDGIPSIDRPRLVESDSASSLSDSDVVIGVNYNGIAKAYPLKILVWHEIVNDLFGDEPLVITYCPLCYSSIAFVRVLNGKAVEFGTSGRLYNSDLVMYDRQIGSNNLATLGSDLTDAGNLWSQMLGQALVGDLAGHKLTRVPTDVMEWKDWKRLNPETLVLSIDTGYTRAYGADPYSGYYTSNRIWFPVANRDERLFEKEVIFGIDYDDKQKAYPVRILDEKIAVNDVFQNRGIVLFKVGYMAVRAFESDVNRKRLLFEFEEGQFIDNETKSVWDEHGEAIDGPLKGTIMKRTSGHIAFWFAWVAFYPETEVFQ